MNEYQRRSQCIRLCIVSVAYKDTKSIQKKMEEQGEKVIIVVIQKLFFLPQRSDHMFELTCELTSLPTF